MSSANTFVAGFLVSVVSSLDALNLANLSMETFGWGAVAGAVLAAVRAGLKLLSERWVVKS